MGGNLIASVWGALAEVQSRGDGVGSGVSDVGMRKLPHTAAEDLLVIIMRRYKRVSTLRTSNRPVEDWGKLLGDVAAVSAMLDCFLHGHVLKCGPRSWRTKSTGSRPRSPAFAD